MYPLEIQGDRIRIREFDMTDVEGALAIVGDDRVTQSLSFDSRTREQTHSMLSGAIRRAQESPRTEYYMAVDNGTLVGFVRLGLSGVKAAKLGYAINADAWGKGYASEAISLLIGWSINVLQLHRITAAIGPSNHASISCVEKLGFQFEGTLRDHVFTNGAWRDSMLFSILAAEWQTNGVPQPVMRRAAKPGSVQG